MDTIKNDIEIGFWQLLSNTNISKVEIPIIQRDFAQGREDEKTKKIRKLFLDNLIKTMESNNPLELDFVYGDIKNEIFQPLDGQQRLTTLFLLHWYLALKTSNLAMDDIQKQLLKFTYETRISSREFCNALVENGEQLGEGKTLTEKITDSSWFFLSWRNDPTIKAMLVMLNGIEERLKEKSDEELKNFWEALTLEKPPITFHFKQLDDIGLTDDLYVKMNARGKALTDFENFKARFEKHINGGNRDKKNWEEDIKDNPSETFSHKVDTVWTDLFWKHRGADNSIDNRFVKFIAGIAINLYAEKQEIYENEEEEREIQKFSKDITTDALKRKRIENRIMKLSNNPNEITPEDFSSKTSFEYLKRCFDIYADTDNKYDELSPESLTLWDFLKPEKVKINTKQELNNNLFIDLVKDGETGYKQRALFYAQTQFLLKQESVNSQSFAEWMRVVRNIVQNATIDSAPRLIGALDLIKELSLGCTDIYDFLNKPSINSRFASTQVEEVNRGLSQERIKSRFALDQVEEEISKASIIINDENDKKIIFQIEDTNFFKGKISFGLRCIGFKKRGDSFNKDACESLLKVVREHLNLGDVSNEFRRALLTVNNQFYNYWGGGTRRAFKTDLQKKCLIKDIGDLKDNFTVKNSNYEDDLKTLLLQLFKKSLGEIIEEYQCPDGMPNWKRRLIKEPKLLEKYCQSHFFGIPDDSECCFLFRDKQRPSSRKECKRIE